MKSTITSFLFFCITILTAYLSNAQVTDSLTYYSGIVDNPTKPEDLAKAYTFFTKEKAKNATSPKKLANELYATQYLAEIQKKLGYSSENELLNLESLKILERIQPKTEWTDISYLRVINELGIIYREREDYTQALKLYQEALTSATTLKNQAVLLNNIGYVYEHLEELDIAYKYYDQAYTKAVEANHTREIARTLSNLSFIKSKLDLPGARQGLLKALELRLSNSYTYELGSSYEHLAKHFFQLKDTISTKKYSDDFIQLARKNNIAELLQSALKLKIVTGEPKYASEYLKINDSLTKIEEEQRNNFNYYVYQYDKKEKDLQKSQLFNERPLYLILFIALASLSIYFVLKYKHRKEKLQEIYNTETRISRKIHDEVANDVYHVMTQLQTSAHDNKELLDDLENIYNRTRDISRQNSTINLTTPYVDLLRDLFLSYKDDQVNIITKGLPSINWEQLKDVQKTTIYRVLQELLTNMKKHSHASIVILSFEKAGKSLIINYKDNGKGTAIIKGNGLQNTENRIHSINGSITFESEIGKGFKAVIMI